MSIEAAINVMKKICINNLLNRKDSLKIFGQLEEKELELDFSNVDEIRFEDIQQLLQLQKIAVFNEIRIKAENMQPHISKIFEQTGMYKILNTLGNVDSSKIVKRQGIKVAA